MVCTLEAKVIDGTMTCLPGPTSKASSANNKAEVHELVANA